MTAADLFKHASWMQCLSWNQTHNLLAVTPSNHEPTFDHCSVGSCALELCLCWRGFFFSSRTVFTCDSQCSATSGEDGNVLFKWPGCYASCVVCWSEKSQFFRINKKKDNKNKLQLSWYIICEGAAKKRERNNNQIYALDRYHSITGSEISFSCWKWETIVSRAIKLDWINVFTDWCFFFISES